MAILPAETQALTVNASCAVPSIAGASAVMPHLDDLTWHGIHKAAATGLVSIK
jgi:hypothetical protein